MNTSFSDILSLAKKTGDTIIITNSDGREPIVVMSFERYRACIDGKTVINSAIEEKHVSELPAETAVESAVVLQKENPEKPQELPSVAEEQFYLEPVE